MKKQLIRCPKCEENHKHSTLGELSPTGYLIIQVTQAGGKYRSFALIGGSDFSIHCGGCGSQVYIKKGVTGAKTVLSDWVVGLHRPSVE
jgi:DNA-directed RNA polymerase subunit RPC12/RpoP